ncbi:MAG: hypothetical protein FRX48_03451 [Lasallia pustulata]|uniref:VPS9 domain-containing protein n=1 Tax=Lasallia pustulata TaxID=136370 RepID=A0A5M8PSB6_9LECA|nr:MAG: hypothetical protein FRX48_03451 [Lasallia pustulata]
MTNDRHAGEPAFRRPQPLQVTKSFSRLEPAVRSPVSRSRASTVHAGTISRGLAPESMDLDLNQYGGSFEDGVVDEKGSHGVFEASKVDTATDDLPKDVPEGFDELPIELISLTDRFISSLTAKVHATPPSVDKLSDLFQDFYIRAESHISTHISTLSSRIHRNASPAPSASSRNSRSSSLALSGANLRSQGSKDTLSSLNSQNVVPEQQMLTPQEISDRKKARRLLVHKGTALEEAVEKRVCESVYDRIWRHRSTLDEVRDEKLRSRTAALALVGIGLKDLGIEMGNPPSGSEEPEGTIEGKIEHWISKAREGLLKMNEARCPLGKLKHLATTYKSILDLLTELHQSSSSADEILPTLIYTLITTPPEGINVISNLQFIQRFRAASKVDGEAAYLLTTLDAAITFLETVDLASLRADETLEGPTKASSPLNTPRSQTPNPWLGGKPISPSMSSPITTPATATSTHSSTTASQHPSQSAAPTKPSPPPTPSHQRRLSELFQPPASAFGAASDAVRTTADQGFKTIGNTLDSSFKLLFGRLKEQHIQGDGVDANGAVIVPRTLDEARRLVDPKPVVDEDGNISGASSIIEHSDSQTEGNSGSKPEERLLGLIGGKGHQVRDKSADSVISTGSGKRVAFATERAAPSSSQLSSSAAPSPQASTAHAPNAAVESMRNLGNTLNPLNRLAGMNMMRGFGRSTSYGAPTPSADRSKEVGHAHPESHPTTSASASKQSGSKVAAPVQRFLDVADAGDLKISEVADLLNDYRRLASALKDLGAL